MKKGYEMTSLALTQRRRTGTALIAVGALLLTMSAILLVGVAPTAGANHDGALPNDNAFPSLAECLSQDNRAGGWKIGINDSTWTASGIQAHGVGTGDVTHSITLVPEHPVINPGQPGAATPNQYFNYEYTGSGFQVQVVFIKIGNAGTSYATSTNPGSVLLPEKTSHLTICFSTETDDTTTTTVADTTTTAVADTTTTTVADTTTTTVAGPDDTTTTTQVAGPDDTTTTTVAGPDDPELPETGPGELLALLAGGLGFTFIGSGSLVIAGDRRRAL
jgi:hypothetical protein